MRYDILPAYTSQFDVGCLTETKTENIPSIEFPNFEIFSKKQKSKAHGIAVFVKSGLFPTIRSGLYGGLKTKIGNRTGSKFFLLV